MSKGKQQHPEFKAKVALEALRVSALVSRFGDTSVETRTARECLECL